VGAGGAGATRNVLNTPFGNACVFVLWWWWVGTRIDYGVLGRRHYRHPTLTAAAFVVAALGLLVGGALGTMSEFQWWKQYGRLLSALNQLLLLRTAGPALWCLVLAGGAGIAAKRLLQGSKSRKSPYRNETPSFR